MNTELLTKVDLTYANKQVREFVNFYNAKQEKVKDRISCAQNLALILVGLYSKSYRNLIARPDSALPALPSLLTNNEQLAKMTNRARKTIVAQRRKLVMAGLIVELLDPRGVQIFIKPEILWINPLTEQIQEWKELTREPAQIIAESLISPLGGQILPPSQILQETNECINSSVDKGIDTGAGASGSGIRSANAQETEESGRTAVAQETTGNDTSNEGWHAKTVPQERKGTPKFPDSQQETKKIPGAAGQPAASSGEPTLQKMYGDITRDQLIRYVENFWSYACKVLYPTIQFYPQEERDAKNLIWQTVYFQYFTTHPVATTKQWENFHNDCIERVTLASRYVEKGDRTSGERFIPRPSIYFDPHNEHGFRATWTWLIRHRTVRNNVQKQVVLQKAIINAQTGKTYSKYKRSRYQIWQTEFNKVSRLNDAELLEAFMASTCALHIPQFYQ